MIHAALIEHLEAYPDILEELEDIKTPPGYILVKNTTSSLDCYPISIGLYQLRKPKEKTVEKKEYKDLEGRWHGVKDDAAIYAGYCNAPARWFITIDEPWSGRRRDVIDIPNKEDWLATLKVIIEGGK